MRNRHHALCVNHQPSKNPHRLVSKMAMRSRCRRAREEGLVESVGRCEIPNCWFDEPPGRLQMFCRCDRSTQSPSAWRLFHDTIRFCVVHILRNKDVDRCSLGWLTWQWKWKNFYVLSFMCLSCLEFPRSLCLWLPDSYLSGTRAITHKTYLPHEKVRKQQQHDTKQIDLKYHPIILHFVS